MPRAKDVEIGVGELYHLHGRGVRKNDLFLDTRDYVRFILLLTHLQSNELLYNVSRKVSAYIKNGAFSIPKDKVTTILERRSIELVQFCLMPNHYHLIVRECSDGGISNYMKRVLGGYGRYFTVKYGVSGHVFQGSYNAVHIGDNEQLVYTSAYIHNNPHDMRAWTGKEVTYPWSTYQDFVMQNRWGELIATDMVLGQFSSPQEYSTYVQSVLREPDMHDMQ